MNPKMGSLFLLTGFGIWLYLYLLGFSCNLADAKISNFTSSVGGQSANGRVEGTVFVNGKHSIGEIDEDFICATLDWWPPEKCDYGTCSWDHASFLNMDLNNNILFNAVKAFSHLKLRLGGTLQDKVIYESRDRVLPCKQFTHNVSEMFGFTQGCLPMQRWDELNTFFNKSGVRVVFGLNALIGRSIQTDGSAVGPWDPTNAASLISYTVEKGYDIYGWELGNELCGNGVGTRVSADQYSADLITLSKVLEDIYKVRSKSKPLVIGPGGFFDAGWFSEFLNKTPGALDVATHHIYNLGPGVDDHLIDKILDPSYLDGEANTFRDLRNLIERNTVTSAVAWVGEAGGAYNSGRNHVTNAFVFSFWYLDQLGMSASYNTKTYCRQTLVGGNYGLLNTTSYEPNPDYYSALLWHRLMGKNVLSTSFSGSKKLRAYAHCAKQSSGITLLLLNLDGNTTVEVKLAFNSSTTWFTYHRIGQGSMSKSKGTKTSWPFHSYYSRAGQSKKLTREEYHLTAKDGDLQSQVIMLNGKTLMLTSAGEIPALMPIIVSLSEPITVGPFSVVFIHIPHIVLPACTEGGGNINGR